MKETLKGFRDFLSRGSVVDLAVAVVVGTAFTMVVHSLVTNILTPIIAAIIGKPSFANLTFTIHHSVFTYGAFIDDLITFVSVAAAVYFFVVTPLARLAAKRAQGDAPPAPPSDEVVLLGQIRDLLANRTAAD